ncbi:PREDICTED: ER membrane protein complex subunit 2-like isoform X1 [Bactrocera latifrons]|uniref:ER membrane protein complex subunit 2-like isoform X1 n=2 Tax=Bactrocera latifrons TaxID=174628 RepID=UPI0008DCB0F9|nr:PREDICTED: ER membrane protein complex subunit 2-like isoform X1 [Bactrocera latifrons]
MAYNFKEMCWKDVRDQFRKWREDNERRSDEVIQLWEALLENHVQKTGNEMHLILEQVLIAAFDTSRLDIAGKCIETLNIEFPESMRVMKFEAMRLEALQMYEEATDLLDEIISKDETNAAPRKRKIAILKARGFRSEAIKDLSEYLKTFMSDQEAWHELCGLYLAEGDYSKAVFCMEELLLHNPHSHLIHQRIAEIRYTMKITQCNHFPVKSRPSWTPIETQPRTPLDVSTVAPLSCGFVYITSVDSDSTPPLPWKKLLKH